MKLYNVEDRDEILNKFDVHAFWDWLYVAHPEIEQQIIVENFGSPKRFSAVVWGTMCKMCLVSEGTTKATKQKAKKKLDQLGMSYDINFIVPKGYKLAQETKSERLQLLIQPTTKAALKELAAAKSISVNELINMVLKDYINKVED